MRWPLTELRSVLRPRSCDVRVGPDATYEFAGVRSFGGGVFRSVVKTGRETSYKQLTRLRAGDLVYPKLMAWEGAIGIVPESCAGCVVSPEFPVFEIDTDAVVPGFLRYFFDTDAGRRLLAGDSTGTNLRRKRLHPEVFLGLRIGLPKPKEQQRIVEQLDGVLGKIAEARRLRAEAEVDLRGAALAMVLDAQAKWQPAGKNDAVRWIQDTQPVEPGKTYSFAGVKSFGNGVFAAGSRSAAEFKYSRLSQVRCRDFIYPKLMAWEGAFGLVPKVLDGCWVSPEFQVFRTDEDIVIPEVLDTYFRSAQCLAAVRKASPGTNARRRRLHPKTFLGLEVPIPSKHVQRSLRKLYEQREELGRFTDHQLEALGTLASAALVRAFDGSG